MKIQGNNGSDNGHNQEQLKLRRRRALSRRADAAGDKNMRLSEAVTLQLKNLDDEFPEIQYDYKYLKTVMFAVFDVNTLEASTAETLHDESLDFIRHLFQKRVDMDKLSASGRMIRFVSLVDKVCGKAKMRRNKRIDYQTK